jgi:N-acetylneuraminic acid mutarotase
MVLNKRHLILFGGFQDNTHNYQYFNDLYAFSLTDYKWKTIKTTGKKNIFAQILKAYNMIYYRTSTITKIRLSDVCHGGW